VNTLVVYESIYGNTREIAEAVAEGLGGAKILAVHDAATGVEDADLVVVGGPTHMHGLATSMSRKMAIEAANEDGHAPVEPGAGDSVGLRRWLHETPKRDGARAATFDTRLDKSPTLTGTAARAIARRLRRRGYDVVGSESFLVEDAEGPLEDGELQRARAWGAKLARQLADASTV
jgi:flavodoxin